MEYVNEKGMQSLVDDSIPSRNFFLFNIETFSGFLIFTLEDKDMKIIDA